MKHRVLIITCARRNSLLYCNNSRGKNTIFFEKIQLFANLVLLPLFLAKIGILYLSGNFLSVLAKQHTPYRLLLTTNFSQDLRMSHVAAKFGPRLLINKSKNYRVET
uniref:Uncharacterized protein n=1 Tax=Vespula pensylvanica TaxID=30213 RepID=A0A834JYS5_VESPE|nr:hypothetical protein H0235_016670 [Vespula pensylvanica]